ncbi:hypothetical protein [Komagataeibacter rhaeticus]|uniref:hypothetical protein n=1 Tax=Komagataeibacter rhaeticus TaxID=215221 RepID=UPI0039EC5DA2
MSFHGRVLGNRRLGKLSEKAVSVFFDIANEYQLQLKNGLSALSPPQGRHACNLPPDGRYGCACRPPHGQKKHRDVGTPVSPMEHKQWRQ